MEGIPSHKESSERGISKGKVEFLAAPSLETLLVTVAADSRQLSGNPQEERARPRFERVGSRERTSPLGPR